MIACTANCVYQNEGACELEQASSSGNNEESGCLNCIKRKEAAE